MGRHIRRKYSFGTNLQVIPLGGQIASNGGWSSTAACIMMMHAAPGPVPDLTRPVQRKPCRPCARIVKTGGQACDSKSHLLDGLQHPARGAVVCLVPSRLQQGAVAVSRSVHLSTRNRQAVSGAGRRDLYSPDCRHRTWRAMMGRIWPSGSRPALMVGAKVRSWRPTPAT